MSYRQYLRLNLYIFFEAKFEVYNFNLLLMYKIYGNILILWIKF